METCKIEERNFIDKLVDIAHETGSFRKVTRYFREHGGNDIFASMCVDAKKHSIKRINRALLGVEED